MHISKSQMFLTITHFEVCMYLLKVHFSVMTLSLTEVVKSIFIKQLDEKFWEYWVTENSSKCDIISDGS